MLKLFFSEKLGIILLSLVECFNDTIIMIGLVFINNQGRLEYIISIVIIKSFFRVLIALP